MLKLGESGMSATWKIALSLCMLLLSSYSLSALAADATVKVDKTERSTAANEEKTMWIKVGDRRFKLALEDNAATRALIKLTPLTLQMAELNGNEKHAELPHPLPMQETRPGAIEVGDVMLYGKNTLVIFYAAFKSGYSYTRLGHLDNPEDLARALGSNGVSVVFSSD